MECIDENKIREAVRMKYAEVSRGAAGKFEYPTGKEGASALGYDPALLESMPHEILRSYCGVGNPFAMGAIRPGATVLDVGCGAGFDLIVASRLVGESGRVYGIDLTLEMAECARSNMARAGVRAEIVHVDSELVPFAEEKFDVIISNGVLNMSPRKEISYAELFRVLKTRGRLQFADIVLREDLPENLIGSMEAWSQ